MVTQHTLTCSGPRRGAVSRQVLIGAGLVIVTVASIVLTVISWRGDSDDSIDPAAIRANRHIDFQCERCGYKFDMAPREFHKQWKDVSFNDLPPGSMFKAHCPKCGGKYCSKMLDDREVPVPPARHR